jgi:hypothetical protein
MESSIVCKKETKLFTKLKHRNTFYSKFKAYISEVVLLIGWIVLILAVLVILAVVGLGWNAFFGGVKKGVEKIGNLPEVKNLTNKAKSEFGGIIGNSTLDVAAILQKI